MAKCMNIDLSELEYILSPKFLKGYWESIRPNIWKVFESIEPLETWTYTHEQLPALFEQVSNILGLLSKTPLSLSDTDRRDIVRGLLRVLTQMPICPAITAVVWLEQNIPRKDLEESNAGWAVALYMEAAHGAVLVKDPEYHAECKNFYSRVNLLLDSTVSSNLFVQLNELVE
jgi:hypothetical protein